MQQTLVASQDLAQGRDEVVDGRKQRGRQRLKINKK